MNRELTVFGTIREAWHLTKGCKWPIIGTILCSYLAMLALIILPVIISMIFFPHHLPAAKTGSLHALATSMANLINAIIYAAGVFFALLVMFGMIAGTLKIAIERSRGNAVSVNMGLRAVWNRMIPVLLTCVVLALILTFLPLLMLFSHYIPTIVDILMYGLYVFLTFVITLLSVPFAVDKTLNPFSAVLQSIRATRGHFFVLLGTLIMLELIALAIQLPSLLGTFLNSDPLVIIGTIFALVAMIWLIPFQMLVFGVMYHKLVD